MNLNEIDIEEPILRRNFVGRKEKLALANGYRNVITALVSTLKQVSYVPICKDNEWEVKYMRKQIEEIIEMIKLNLEEEIKYVRRREIPQ